MVRFIVRYYDVINYKKSGCCNKPFSLECNECKNWCLHVTTVEASSAEDAVAFQRKFCSTGAGFSAEQIKSSVPPKEPAKVTDKKWPYVRKNG